MREKVYKDLYVGSDQDCFMDERKEWAVVHACKHPCHQRAVGYKGSLPKNHPNYLKYKDGSHLYLNLIDPPERPLFCLTSFEEAMVFIEEKIANNKVLTHCNEGLSRAPSIVLLYLATVEGVISSSSYSAAMEDFVNQYYPRYNPAGGIRKFLDQNWNKFN